MCMIPTLALPQITGLNLPPRRLRDAPRLRRTFDSLESCFVFPFAASVIDKASAHLYRSCRGTRRDALNFVDPSQKGPPAKSIAIEGGGLDRFRPLFSRPHQRPALTACTSPRLFGAFLFPTPVFTQILCRFHHCPLISLSPRISDHSGRLLPNRP